MRPAPPLKPLEIAYGLPIGAERALPLEPQVPCSGPRAALEAVLIEALSRRPCLVSFSGGRDSSALLALAVHVARREGLDLPVPATLVFPGSRAANEEEWQRAVLQHLCIEEQLRIEIAGDELDAVGPVATDVLQRHGLVWPFNTHFHRPIMERASGGTVVTGFGGDEVARTSATSYAERALSRWHWPSGADLLVVGLALSPRAVRAEVHRRRFLKEASAFPWLTREGRRQLARALGDDQAAVPLGWSRTLRERIWRDRYFRICREAFSLVADDLGVRMVHPFLHERVLDALAQSGGFRGFGGRTELMATLFGDLLPEQVVGRTTKGVFTEPLWTTTAVEFARHWSGRGVDPELVDPERLRDHWLDEDRSVLSTTLLQQAWLHDRRPA